MSYVNTGYTRKKSLVITKGDYSHTYDFCAGFTDPEHATIYPSITTTAFAQMSDTDYLARRAAFIRYVYSQESGLSTDCPDMTVGSTGYNTTLCPLP